MGAGFNRHPCVIIAWVTVSRLVLLVPLVPLMVAVPAMQAGRN